MKRIPLKKKQLISCEIRKQPGLLCLSFRNCDFFKCIFILLFYCFKHGLAATGVVWLMNEQVLKLEKNVRFDLIFDFLFPLHVHSGYCVSCVCASLCMEFFFFFLNQCVVKNKTNPPPINKLCLSTVILFD